MAQQTVRILVVDDEKQICEFLKEKFSLQEWEVTFFLDGRKAVEQLIPNYFQV